MFVMFVMFTMERHVWSAVTTGIVSISDRPMAATT